MSKYHSKWIERDVYYRRGENVCEDGILIPKFEAYERPLIVCLIGSSRFKEQHIETQKRLTLEVKIVLPMGMFGHMEDGFDMDGPIKKMLDDLHLDKIALADEVYVVNPLAMKCSVCGKVSEFNGCCGIYPQERKPYIGESTKRELEYARKLGKTILSLNPLENV